MKPKEIKAVFDRTFNGLPNPVFCYPVGYFEHKGFLCEIATSPSGENMAQQVKKKLYRNPLAIFDMMFSDCGNWLTVLTPTGERTEYGGHFDTKAELETLLSELPDIQI